MLLTCISKLEIVSGGFTDLDSAAAIGRVPGLVVWVLVVCVYVALIGIALVANRTYAMGSEAAQAVLRQEPD